MLPTLASASSSASSSGLVPKLLAAATLVLCPLQGAPALEAQQAPLVPAGTMGGDPLPEFIPGASYDPSIPTLESVVGHAIRDEITSPEEIVFYFRALAEAAPDRTRLIEYGETWEGRPLIALLVGSPSTMSRLDEVQAGLQRLTDPA